MAATGNTTDFGNLTAAAYSVGGAASPTRAIRAGGGSPLVNVIDYVEI